MVIIGFIYYSINKLIDKKKSRNIQTINHAVTSYNQNKQCRYCKMWIDSEASVCPHCQKRQPMSSGKFMLWLALILICIFLWYANYSTEYDNNMASNTVTMENFNKIKTGMTYEEVCEIFGKPGTGATGFTVTVGVGDTTVANSIEYKKWSTRYISGSVVVAFSDNKVLTKIANNLE